MRIGARAHHDADFLGRLHGRHIPLRGLHGPADAERFHAPQVLGRSVIQMRDRPAQVCDGDLFVHALEDVQQQADGIVARPVHGDRHAALGGPSDDLVVLLALGLGGLIVVIHRPGDPLADAVEAQHVIAEAHRQQLRQILQFLEFLAGRDAAQAVGDAHR